MTTIDLSSLSSESTPSSQILNVLSTALNTPNQNAKATADELDKLYQDGQEAEDFLWTFWTLYIEAAKMVLPKDEARLQLLVDAVGVLKGKQRGEVEIWGNGSALWGDLPLLGPCMREAWNARPGPDAPESKASAWLSLNSFAARLLGAGTTSWTNFAIWELRSTLEEETPNSASARDVNMSTACEWLTHAGKVLHGQSADPPKLEEADKRALRPGGLLVSQQKQQQVGEELDGGLSLARWRFWRGRVEELGGQVGDAEVKEKAGGMVKSMKALEG